jgi:hypothetical protein
MAAIPFVDDHHDRRTVLAKVLSSECYSFLETATMADAEYVSQGIPAEIAVSQRQFRSE